jgi:hypothetical protein
LECTSGTDHDLAHDLGSLPAGIVRLLPLAAFSHFAIGFGPIEICDGSSFDRDAVAGDIRRDELPARLASIHRFSEEETTPRLLKTRMDEGGSGLTHIARE